MTDAEFPMLPPEGVPDSLLDTTRILFDPDSIGGDIYSGLVMVLFDPIADASDRGLSVAAVGGTVVGGRRTPGYLGYDTYVLTVPDDSSGAGVAAAVRALNSDPVVRAATPVFAHVANVTAVLPTDGSGMSALDYNYDPDSSFTPTVTWGLNTIGAPHAWSCATGKGVKVAVIDLGHATNTELGGRIAPSSNIHPALVSGVGRTHGQWVAGTIGATANNSAGTAGIAHDATLQLIDLAQYDAAGNPTFSSSGSILTSTIDGENALYDAMLDSARIVNISLGWTDTTTGTPPDSFDMASWAWESNFLVKKLQPLLATRKLPLIVISAGNNGLTANAQWGEWGSLRHHELMDSVVITVSGGGTIKGSRAFGAGGSASAGGTVDLYAPGMVLPVFDANGGLNPSGGTGSSFAAPLVAGAAALALEVNPGLTSHQLRDLLIAAGSTSRAVLGTPFLDAYEVVKRAAQGDSASLCGNRVWADTLNNVYAQRQTGARFLFQAGSSPGAANAINVYRGGRHIDLPVTGAAFRLPGTSWQAATYFGDDSSHNWSGSFKASVGGTDQGERFYSGVSAIVDSGSAHITLTWAREGRGSFPSDTTFVAPLSLSLAGGLSSTCVMRVASDSSCVQSALAGSGEYVTQNLPAYPQVPLSGPIQLGGIPHALDPRGRFVVIPIAIKRLDAAFSSTWASCAGLPGMECRSVVQEELTSVRTMLVRIRIGATAAEVLTTTGTAALGTGDEVYFSSISVDGGEMTLQVGSSTMAGFAFSSCTNARYVWLSLPTGSGTSAPAAHSVSVPGHAMCQGNLWGSAGVFDRLVP